MRFFEDITLLSQDLHFSTQPSQFLFRGWWISTARERLYPGFRKLLAPMMQGTVCNAQISCNLRLGFATRLHELYRFHLAFLREDFLVFWHDALHLDALFSVYILRESPSSPLFSLRFGVRRSSMKARPPCLARSWNARGQVITRAEFAFLLLDGFVIHPHINLDRCHILVPQEFL